ncbi:hypothetical protein GALMADRAFT_826510 [Galerina marginata CBS 339.88]|uniref:Uncharacterized protein n=1 Tax=Galerina marginata (strain CBS 339.88) TaxID=685588 RepID=A0A067TH35_GALM3|nr:hypothetical protein GALMADRAFT_826510 [Galerina marginata CBS 339.88]
MVGRGVDVLRSRIVRRQWTAVSITSCCCLRRQFYSACCVVAVGWMWDGGGAARRNCVSAVNAAGRGGQGKSIPQILHKCLAQLDVFLLLVHTPNPSACKKEDEDQKRQR